MRSGRVALCKFSQTFTTTGNYDPYIAVGSTTPWPLAVSPVLWSLEVIGYNSSGVVTAPTAWDVYLLGSLDGVNFNLTSALVEHTNTGSAQSNGDLTWSSSYNNAPGQFRGTKFVRIRVNALTLGSAANIKVFAEGY